MAEKRTTCTVCGALLSRTQRKYCGNACKSKAHYHAHKSNPNSYYSQTVRAVRRKLMFVRELGGGCSVCGYRRNLAALDFHHEGEKQFKVDARRLSNTSVPKLRKELDACVLLCANCHRERHHPELEWERAVRIAAHRNRAPR